jgi:hypothetical protein
VISINPTQTGPSVPFPQKRNGRNLDIVRSAPHDIDIVTSIILFGLYALLPSGIQCVLAATLYWWSVDA